MTCYDVIGAGYTRTRRTDPRIAAIIHAALGTARTVLNVGAGAGSYEPADRTVIAVEPSTEMIRQRPADAAIAVRASADNLPFDDDTFDATMGVLTLHHWPDKEAGLREVRRVTRGPLVLVTFDPAARPWLTDYLPALAELDAKQFPQLEQYAEWLGQVHTEPIPVPHDCSDGFLYSYWRRPHAYLDPLIRTGSSSFQAIAPELGLRRLEHDLASGRWHQQHANLLALTEYDAGYRLVVAEG